MSDVKREGGNDQCQNVPEKSRRQGQITDSWNLEFELLDFVKVDEREWEVRNMQGGFL